MPPPSHSRYPIVLLPCNLRLILLLIDEGQYYLVSFQHVVISNDRFSSFIIISATLIVLYYKDNLLLGLHYPIILIVCNKREIISTFYNKNLTISWCMSHVVTFSIMTHIS